MVLKVNRCRVVINKVKLYFKQFSLNKSLAELSLQLGYLAFLDKFKMPLTHSQQSEDKTVFEPMNQELDVA